MRNGEKDIDEFSAQLKKRNWREIDRSHRLHLPTTSSLRDCKSRITIYLDADIVSKFKETAEKENIGYQTLINDALRRLVDTANKETEKQILKEELLKDKKFLRKLKTALAA